MEFKKCLKKLRLEYHLTKAELNLSDESILYIINHYTKESGIRLFCLLNIAMATATLKLLNDADPDSDRIVKISRKTVKILYILSKMVVKNNFLTRMFFYYVSRGVKRTKRDPHELRNRVSCWERLRF